MPTASPRRSTVPGRSRRWRPLLLAGLCASAYGQPALPTSLGTLPAAWQLSAETLELPQGEHLGLVGGKLLFEVEPGLRLGAGMYGAVRGQRGGFITLGMAGEYRHRLSPAWQGHGGAFVGAGGGRDANALVGGGLMLAADLGLTYESRRLGHFGFGVSHVRFPSGAIQSTQPYVRYEYPFRTLMSSGWETPGWSGAASGLGTFANEFAVVGRSYRIPASVKRDNGAPQHPALQLLGVAWLTYLDDHWFLKLESEGAMGGESNGYMQILAGPGYRLRLSPRSALKVHAAAGPAGGGGVDTGGGLLVDCGVSFQRTLHRGTALELSLGTVRAPSRGFRATSLALACSRQFGLPAVASESVPWASLDGFRQENLRVRIANQTYFKAAPHWRKDPIERSISNLGVQLDYFRSPSWFLTGQGLAAYAGEAGAYMIGLVGVGRRWSPGQRWFLEGEALLGAAGGGGVEVGGGLVAQVDASLGYRFTKAVSALASCGRIQSLRGDFRANLAGLSLAYQFTAYTSK